MHPVVLLEVLSCRASAVRMRYSVMKLACLWDGLETASPTVACVSPYGSRTLIHHGDHHHLVQSALQIMVYRNVVEVMRTFLNVSWGRMSLLGVAESFSISVVS